MKRLYAFITVCLLAVMPLIATVPVQDQTMKEGYEESAGGDIPVETLHEVLTLAAPHFNQIPSQFIRLYDECGCIVVNDLGNDVYRVIYGGIGIEILVDVSSTLLLEDRFFRNMQMFRQF